MAGGDAATFQHLEAVHERLAAQVHLVQMTPGQMAQAVAVARRHVPLRRPDPLDGDRRITLIPRRYPAFDQVVVRMDAVVQRQAKWIDRIAQVNTQLRRVAVVPFSRFEAQHDGAHAIRERDLEAWVDKLDVLVAGILLRGKLGGAIEGPWIGMQRSRIVLAVGQSFAPIAMRQQPGLVQPKGVAGHAGFQYPAVIGRVDRHGFDLRDPIGTCALVSVQPYALPSRPVARCWRIAISGLSQGSSPHYKRYVRQAGWRDRASERS